MNIQEIILTVQQDKCFRGHNSTDYAITNLPWNKTTGCTPEIAIVVHGWGLNNSQSQERFDRVKMSLEHNRDYIPVIGYSWDANVLWPIAQSIAKSNGPKLAQLILKDFTGFVSACAFGPSVDTPNCAYFDLSKIFIEKGGKKDFIAGFVSIESNTPPPSAMQVCLEAQLLNGTNASPGNWSRCGPVTKDNNGFYISKTDFTGLDHSKLGLYPANTNTNTSVSNTALLHD